MYIFKKQQLLFSMAILLMPDMTQGASAESMAAAPVSTRAFEVITLAQLGSEFRPATPVAVVAPAPVTPPATPSIYSLTGVYNAATSAASSVASAATSVTAALPAALHWSSPAKATAPTVPAPTVPAPTAPSELELLVQLHDRLNQDQLAVTLEPTVGSIVKHLESMHEVIQAILPKGSGMQQKIQWFQGRVRDKTPPSVPAIFDVSAHFQLQQYREIEHKDITDVPAIQQLFVKWDQTLFNKYASTEANMTALYSAVFRLINNEKLAREQCEQALAKVQADKIAADAAKAAGTNASIDSTSPEVVGSLAHVTTEAERMDALRTAHAAELTERDSVIAALCAEIAAKDILKDEFAAEVIRLQAALDAATKAAAATTADDK